VRAVATTPDGKHAVSGSDDNTLKVWYLESGEEKTTLKGHGDWVRAVATTLDGKYAVSGSDDNTPKVWDLKREEEKQH
jgi:WD40 repeat protein